MMMDVKLYGMTPLYENDEIKKLQVNITAKDNEIPIQVSGTIPLENEDLESLREYFTVIQDIVRQKLVQRFNEIAQQ